MAASVLGTNFELRLEIIEYIFEYSFVELYDSSMVWIVKRQNIYPYIFVFWFDGLQRTFSTNWVKILVLNIEKAKAKHESNVVKS